MLTGNTTREPELRYTTGGHAVCNFGLAVNRQIYNAENDDYEDQVSFFEITVWRMLAENVAESIPKGARVTVAGSLDQQTWENEDGENRSKVRVIADDVAASLAWATVDIYRSVADAAPDDEDEDEEEEEEEAPKPKTKTRARAKTAKATTKKRPAKKSAAKKRPAKKSASKKRTYNANEEPF